MSDFITRREQYLAYIAGESDTYPDEPITREETFLAEIALRIASGGTGGSGGVGILKIEKTATNGKIDTYTVTYTDNSTFAFTVTNGKDGTNGRGISSIEKTSTSGLVDTYTITYTDKTTATFTVTNGKEGTSVTIEDVSESTADGGSNVVAFSDGKTLTVKNGRNGANGKTPYVKNNTWWIGDTDTGIKAEGTDGKGIKSFLKISTNELVDTYRITYTDGTTTAIDVTNGKDGHTPIKGVDYYTEADKAEFSQYIASELAKRGQLKPEPAQTLADMTDTSLMYVLLDKTSPDYGYIFAYMWSEGGKASYTNLSETVLENKRLGSGGTISDLTGAITTDFIPIRKGQILRFKGFDPTTMPSDKYPYICFYTGASEASVVSSGVWDRLDWFIDKGCLQQDNSEAWYWTAFKSPQNNPTSPYEHPLADSITHVRLCGTMIEGETVIVTVDEEITEGSSGGYAWQSTGRAFVPADYEDRIVDLENNKANKSDIPKALKNPYSLTINGVKYDGSKAVEVDIESSGNILFGKKWVACGDSFTAGGYNASDGFEESEYIYQDGRFAGRYKVYPNIIGLRNNMNIVNLATGGQTMGISDNSFMTRYATIPADADYITIMLGINDKLQGIPVGTLEDNTNTTFCGAYNIALAHIIENHPFAHIGIIVSNGTNEEIMEATRNIAEWWGLPYLDFGSPQVPLFNRYTGKNVNPEVVKIREKNFCISSDGVTPTNAHPNTKAHEYESTFIEAWLRTL